MYEIAINEYITHYTQYVYILYVYYLYVYYAHNVYRLALNEYIESTKRIHRKH